MASKFGIDESLSTEIAADQPSLLFFSFYFSILIVVAFLLTVIGVGSLSF